MERIDTQHANVAAIWLAKALHTFDGCRLPRPVWPNDSENLAPLDLKREVVQGDRFAVSLPQVANNDSGVRHGEFAAIV